MPDQGDLFSVTFFMDRGQVYELVYKRRDDVAKAVEAWQTAKREVHPSLKIGDDFGLTMFIRTRSIQMVHIVSMSDAHRRQVDVQDTQEAIALKYEPTFKGRPGI